MLLPSKDIHMKLKYLVLFLRPNSTSNLFFCDDLDTREDCQVSFNLGNGVFSFSPIKHNCFIQKG